MNVLVILAVAGVCVAHPQGFLSDTPEVIAEKQRFFQLYNAAARAASSASDHNQISRQASPSSSFQVASEPIWRGPLASSVPAGVNGNFNQVQDTPEVLAAKAAFDIAYQQQLRSTIPSSPNHHHQSTFSQQQAHFAQPQAHFSQPQSSPVNSATNQLEARWNGPVAATIPAGLPGSVSQVRNTPEVEEAIAEFTRAYNSAVVGANRNTQHQQQHTSFNNNVQHRSSQPIHHPNAIPESFQQPKWTGPFAATIPAGLPGSSAQVQDTPEVASAKAAFQRAFQQQLVYSG